MQHTVEGALIGAVEAGGTKFILAIARADGTILERARIATRGPGETFAEMAGWFEAAGARHGRIGAFGIGSFGPLGTDPARADYTTFATTPKPGWRGTSYRDALARFPAPIALDTDVNAAALGEWLAGAGRGCGSLAYTTIGTGIGTGVLKDGTPLAGFSHYESGHLLVRRDPARDPFAGICPFHGDCLEGLASGSAIAARWGRDLSSADPGQVALIAGYAARHAPHARARRPGGLYRRMERGPCRQDRAARARRRRRDHRGDRAWPPRPFGPRPGELGCAPATKAGAAGRHAIAFAHRETSEWRIRIARSTS